MRFTDLIVDESGRVIAPPQSVPDPIPAASLEELENGRRARSFAPFADLPATPARDRALERWARA